MDSLIFAFLAYFGWGIGDTYSAVLSRKLGAETPLFWSYVLRLGLYIIFVPFFINDATKITWPTFLINLAVAGSVVSGYYFYLKAFSVRQANPAVIGTISTSWGAPSLLLALVFLKEGLTLTQLLAILMIFVGLFFMSILGAKIKTNKSLLYAFITFLSWGFCGTFVKFPVQQYGWFWSTFIMVIPVSLVVLLTKFKQNIANPIKQKILWPLLLYAGLIALAESSYNLGVGLGKASIVAPIAGSYATLFVLLSFIFFKDPISKNQKIGLALALTGIVWLSFLSA